MRGDDDSARARPLGAADDGAEVLWVGDLVETDEQWHVAAGQLVGVRVPERVAPGEHALVVPRARSLRELPLGPDVMARRMLDPRNRRGRPFGGPDLVHPPWPADGLPDGIAPVDELAGQGRRTSR